MLANNKPPGGLNRKITVCVCVFGGGVGEGGGDGRKGRDVGGERG